MARIHPTAVVDPAAKLADDVEVGPYAVVGGDVDLAQGVWVGAHSVVTGRTRVGSRTRIGPHAVVGTEPQVVGGPAAPGALVIGEDNRIREFVTIHVGTGGGAGCTRIGDDNLLMNNVHVAHDCRVGSHCVLSGFAGLCGHVSVGDHAMVGGRCGVHQFVRIGESAFAAGNAMLSRDAPPFAVVVGDRARFAGVNRLGLSRRGFSEEAVAHIKHAMHVLFQSKLRFSDAVARVARDCAASPEVGRLLCFLRESQNGRGFIR